MTADNVPDNVLVDLQEFQDRLPNATRDRSMRSQTSE
jgi:hypothetical protein